MLVEFLALALLSGFIAAAIWQWRHQETDHPIALWAQTFPGAEAIAIDLGSTLGLAAERTPRTLRWLTKTLLLPISLFWGALRSQRPEEQLTRWFLQGAYRGRQIRVSLDGDGANVSMSCTQGVWAEEASPLAQQEGLRPLHPVHSPRWNEGTRLIEALFAIGVRTIRSEGNKLLIRVPLNALAPTERQRLFESLSGLVAVIET